MAEPAHDLTVYESLDDLDAKAVRELLDAAEEHDGHPALADAKVVELHGGPWDAFAAAVWTGARFVAYCHATHSDGAWNLQTVVHPSAREGDTAYEATAAAVAEARRRGAQRVHWWTFRANEWSDALAARLDMAPWRDLLNMVCPLPHPDPPELSDGVTVRAFVPGQDDDAWLVVNGRAFADHPEQGTWGQRDLDARMAEPWFDPSGFLVAEAGDGSLAGFCWTKVPDLRHGEIYVIGVDPSWEGKGLGRALVLAGLAHMAERGLPLATLYTDAGNDRAVAMYEKLGFSVDHVDRAYA